MKTKNLNQGRNLVFLVAAGIAVNFTYGQTTIYENTSREDYSKAEFGNSDNRFFVKRAENSNVSVLSVSEGMQSIVQEVPAAKVNLVGNLAEEKVSPFSTVSAKNNSGKNYLHWIVQKDEKSGIFIVERSANGYDFAMVGSKNRINSAIPQLSYYFSDTSVPSGTFYYRILALDEDGSFKYSDVMTVENPDGKIYF